MKLKEIIWVWLVFIALWFMFWSFYLWQINYEKVKFNNIKKKYNCKKIIDYKFVNNNFKYIPFVCITKEYKTWDLIHNNIINDNIILSNWNNDNIIKNLITFNILKVIKTWDLIKLFNKNTKILSWLNNSKILTKMYKNNIKGFQTFLNYYKNYWDIRNSKINNILNSILLNLEFNKWNIYFLRFKIDNKQLKQIQKENYEIYKRFLNSKIINPNKFIKNY